ncbi:MAG: hypothetical protein R3Y23_02215 [Bacillota bacterium]
MRNKIIASILLVYLCIAAMCGCTGTTNGDNSVTVKNISLCLETIKDWYTVGDSFYYDGAEIYVYYSDTSIGRVNITSSMLFGFDTSKEGENFTCSVEYGGTSTTLTYDVVAAGSIGTSDLAIDLSYADYNGSINAYINLSNLDSEEAGIYAISFEISLTNATIGSIDYTISDDFTVVVKEVDGVAYFLCYATEGNSTIKMGGFEVRVYVLMEGDTASIKVDNCVISDKLCDKSVTMNRINIVQ